MEDFAPASLEAAGTTRPPRSLQIHAFGPIEAFSLCAGALTHEDDAARTIASREHGYAILLVTEGEARSRHYGHSMRLAPGDFMLVDGSAPLDFGFEKPGEVLVLRVPARALRNHLPSPEQFCGQPLRAVQGFAQDAAGLVRCIFGQLEDGLSPLFRDRIAHNLLGTLGTAFAMALEGGPDGPQPYDRNARLRLRIERDLRDPDLSPSRIAARLRTSPRNLGAVVAASNETVAAYILRRRLEECARELADPARSRASIGEIAFGWGFLSTPHFTRSFRERYGMSPRQYRTCVARPCVRGMTVDVTMRIARWTTVLTTAAFVVADPAWGQQQSAEKQFGTVRASVSTPS